MAAQKRVNEDVGEATLGSIRIVAVSGVIADDERCVFWENVCDSECDGDDVVAGETFTDDAPVAGGSELNGICLHIFYGAEDRT